jgi:AbiJ N-terminal domain 4
MNNLTYSKQKKMIEQGNRLDQSEVYQYDKLPIEFRRQVIHIWKSAISAYPSYLYLDLQNSWGSIHGYLIRKLGLFKLGHGKGASPEVQCSNFLLSLDTSIDNILILLERTFQYIDKDIRKSLNNYRVNPIYLRSDIYQQLPDDAINELNARFREHSIGYQYNNGQIMRVDSGFIHAEVVIPALNLLSSQDFSGAEQEFRIAHKYYREQEYKEAITNASKAFESTMKTICDKLEWTYDKQKATASDLIRIVLDNELIPRYLETHLSGLKSLLVSTTTVRNRSSGHGQGSDPIYVPEYLAGYALHITASNIVFLVEAYKNKQSS